MISIIAAIGKKYELGKKGGLCFHIKEDMDFFKKTTTGHSVLMGLTTWKSIKKPLKNRQNYVLSFDTNENLPENVKLVTNLKDFLEKWQKSPEKLFIIGGASVYEQSLKFANEIFLTEIEAEDHDADVFFPKFNQNNWQKTVLSTNESNNIKYTFVHYQKKEEL